MTMTVGKVYRCWRCKGEATVMFGARLVCNHCRACLRCGEGPVAGSNAEVHAGGCAGSAPREAT